MGNRTASVGHTSQRKRRPRKDGSMVFANLGPGLSKGIPRSPPGKGKDMEGALNR